MTDTPRPAGGSGENEPEFPDIPDDLSSLGDLGVEVPDDLSGLTQNSSVPDLAVLITQIAGAEPLAAAASLAGLDLDAVPTEVGALAVLRDPSGSGPDDAAAALSQVVRGVPLVQVTRKGEQLTCVRWTDGERGDEISPALLLGGAPQTVEDVLTGYAKVADLEGVVASGEIGRLKAMRMLSSAARKARRASRGKPGTKDGA
ncbi:hypothetical protein [Myceligenerans salitolerans]|uniref:hypothetical protein n=1 Tax=Myceligenerans salitolerans TaxID=1230528 RepID=UPI001F5EFB2A|nr:hypothetical protein [Myceligenerans salitolerans]